jgi:hypothetical protein
MTLLKTAIQNASPSCGYGDDRPEGDSSLALEERQVLDI